jgi:hypothetical protein
MPPIVPVTSIRVFFQTHTVGYTRRILPRGLVPCIFSTGLHGTDTISIPATSDSCLAFCAACSKAHKKDEGMSYAPNYHHDEEHERNHAALGVNPSLQPSSATTTTSSTMTSLQPEFRLVLSVVLYSLLLDVL